MKTTAGLALAGLLLVGSTTLVAAQNYTPSLGLPNGSYLPPIDNPYFSPDYDAGVRYNGRSTYVNRDRRFVQPYQDQGLEDE